MAKRDWKDWLIIGLLLLIVALLVWFLVFKPKSSSTSSPIKDSAQSPTATQQPETSDQAQEPITPPYETRYFRLAAEFLAGQPMDHAKSISPPDPLVTAEPTGCNVEPAGVDYDYDASQDSYGPPILAVPGMEKRPISIVTCTYDGYPYQTEVMIDTMYDRVAGWTVGQR